MTKIETKEIGNIYVFFENEVTNYADIGNNVILCSIIKKFGTSWYLQGDNGTIHWAAAIDKTYDLCYRWLKLNYYMEKGELPPECFEYKKV